MSEPRQLPTFDYAQGYPSKSVLPARMTVLPLADGKLALVSPIPIDDDLAREIDALGQVELLIAPNLFHHLYLAAACARYPHARVLAPAGLSAKRPDVRIQHALDTELPALLTDAVQVVRVEGAPRIDEYVFFHRATRTLVVTDLVFNMVNPRGFLPNLVLFLMGVHGKLAQSRMWRLLANDRDRVASSYERMLALPFETLVVAHGQIVTQDARAALTRALRWLLPPRQRLAAKAAGQG